MTITYAMYKGRKAENPKAKLFDIAVTHWPRTAGRFSHGEWLAPNGLCYSSSFRDGGVRHKYVDVRSGRWVLYTVPATQAEIDAHYQWFFDHRDDKYDVASLAGFVLPWRVSDSKRVFCTECHAACRGLEEPRLWHPNRFAGLLAAMPGCVIQDL